MPPRGPLDRRGINRNSPRSDYRGGWRTQGKDVLKKKLARTTPQHNSKSHAHCRSLMAGIMFRNVALQLLPNSRVPTGMPRMVIPLSLGPL